MTSAAWVFFFGHLAMPRIRTDIRCLADTCYQRIICSCLQYPIMYSILSGLCKSLRQITCFPPPPTRSSHRIASRKPRADDDMSTHMCSRLILRKYLLIKSVCTQTQILKRIPMSAALRFDFFRHSAPLHTRERAHCARARTGTQINIWLVRRNSLSGCRLRMRVMVVGAMKNRIVGTFAAYAHGHC